MKKYLSLTLLIFIFLTFFNQNKIFACQNFLNDSDNTYTYMSFPSDELSVPPYYSENTRSLEVSEWETIINLKTSRLCKSAPPSISYDKIKESFSLNKEPKLNTPYYYKNFTLMELKEISDKSSYNIIECTPSPALDSEE